MALRAVADHVEGKQGHTQGFVYALFRHHDHAIKIGYSKAPMDRLHNVKTFKANGRVSMVGSVTVSCMACSEARAHSLLQEKRLAPDWYTGTEWFAITQAEAIGVLYAC